MVSEGGATYRQEKSRQHTGATRRRECGGQWGGSKTQEETRREAPARRRSRGSENFPCGCAFSRGPVPFNLLGRKYQLSVRTGVGGRDTATVTPTERKRAHAKHSQHSTEQQHKPWGGSVTALRTPANWGRDGKESWMNWLTVVDTPHKLHITHSPSPVLHLFVRRMVKATSGTASPGLGRRGPP